MVDYFEKLSGGFPRRANFARRNLMERQKSIPAGYKLPAPRPNQYGSPSTYSASYAYGYVTSGKLHANESATRPRPPNTAPSTVADPAITGTDQPAPTAPSTSGRLKPSRPPAMMSLIERLSRPTATSAAKRSRTAGWAEEGNNRALEQYVWSNMEVFIDSHKAFYTPEGSVRAPITSLSQEVDCHP